MRRINRYIMECKWQGSTPRKNLKHELIDTLWNVNAFDVTLKIFPSFGINRYIMECK